MVVAVMVIIVTHCEQVVAMAVMMVSSIPEDMLVACQSLTSSLEGASSEAGPHGEPAAAPRSYVQHAEWQEAQNSRRRFGGVGAER